MRHGCRVSVIMPAFNEELSIGHVLEDMPDWVDEVVVADNASTDGTAAIAEAYGATVVHEPRRGYGSACLRAMGALSAPDVVVFIDADYSDRPEEMHLLTDPIIEEACDIVIGSRVLGNAERGSLTPQQRWGNWLACFLIELLYDAPFTDLGPFRAVRYSTLLELGMRDRDWGWTVELQLKAAQRKLSYREVPVSYRPRIGVSKISGTLSGVVKAGWKILYTIFSAAVRPGMPSPIAEERLIVFTRWPEAGKTKTRMIPALEPEGAAELQRAMTVHALITARAATVRQSQLAVYYAGGTDEQMASWLGPDLEYRPQAAGSLGEKMSSALEDAFNEGVQRALIIGTDCPDLTPHHMRQAFALLRGHDAVTGPAEDGGYYCIGARLPVPHLFAGIEWGTASVFEATQARAREHGTGLALLPTLRDVDVPEDLKVWEDAQRRRARDIDSDLEVIVLACNEEQCIANAVSLLQVYGDAPVAVSDGASTDRTRELASTYGARVLQHTANRGAQLNAAIQETKAPKLLLMHADCLPPKAYARHVGNALGDGAAAGAFRLHVPAPGLIYRLIDKLANLRSRWRGLPYGDQSIFVTREAWERAGGFPAWPLMEDYDFMRRVGRAGRLAKMPAAWSIASPRRWQKAGPWRLTLLHQLIIVGYHLGLPVQRMGRWRD